MPQTLYQLDPEHCGFPPADQALYSPPGLLAIGGDLHPQRLLEAYRHGIFPWFSEGEPIAWWSPDPRCLFDTRHLQVPRRLLRTFRGKAWTLSMDRAFAEVIGACAQPRQDAEGTWITPAMCKAYLQLHQQGQARSFEVWEQGRLVAGLYGVAVGGLFSGESMFSRVRDGSKAALFFACAMLARHNCPWLDAQVSNHHTLSLGAKEYPREHFLRELERLRDQTGLPDIGKVRTPWPNTHALSTWLMTLRKQGNP